MNLDPKTLHLIKDDTGIKVHIDGQIYTVDRIARAFPRTNPECYVSLLNTEGHEIGLIENPSELQETSRNMLEAELKAIYFIPTIIEIFTVTPKGTGSFWEVLTDDGPFSFRIMGRDDLNGYHPPSIEITDENGKRYRIVDYWELDPDSRDRIADLLPDKILKARFVRDIGMSGGGGGGRGGGGGGGGGGGRR